MEIILKIGAYAGAASFFGLALVVPLYFSQARDIRRLRTWKALTPDISVAEAEAAEAARIAEEAEAPSREQVLPDEPPAPAVPPAAIDDGPPVVPGLGRSTPPAGTTPARGVAPIPGATPVPGTTPVRPLTPAERIALDRPATARITAERPVVAAPPPQGRLRRLIRMPTTTGLVGTVGTVLVLAIVVVVVVIQTGNGGEEALERPRASAVVPADVEVAVLNGTPVPDLAARVGDDVEANDFTLGRVTNSESPFEKTVVMYEPGSEDEGQAVGKALGLARVLPMAPDVRALAEGAPVVVIAGEDRAQQ